MLKAEIWTALAPGDPADVTLAHQPLDPLPVDPPSLPAQRCRNPRGTVCAARRGVDLPDLGNQLVLPADPFFGRRPGREVGEVAGAGHPEHHAQQGDAVATGVVLGGLLRVDERVARSYFVDSFAKKAALDSTGQSNSAG